jgi:hypothetical protein
MSMLLGALTNGAPLPNVVGISATSRLETLKEEFDVVYAHPQDPAAERELLRLMRPLHWRQPPPPATKPSDAVATPPPQVRPSGNGWRALEIALFLVLVTIGLAVIVNKSGRLFERVTAAAPPRRTQATVRTKPRDAKTELLEAFRKDV